MPTLPIVAVFYGGVFIQFEYADHSRGEYLRTDETEFIRLADTMTFEEWGALQRAIKTPQQWTPVKDVEQVRKEFKILTDYGPILIGAESKEDAVRLAEQDGYRIMEK